MYISIKLIIMNIDQAGKFGKVQGLLKFIMRNTKDLSIKESAQEAYNHSEELISPQISISLRLSIFFIYANIQSDAQSKANTDTTKINSPISFKVFFIC